jgi:hypothetical protein
LKIWSQEGRVETEYRGEKEIANRVARALAQEPVLADDTLIL